MTTKQIQAAYYDPTTGLTSVKKLTKRLKEQGIKVNQKQVQQVLNDQEPYQQFKTRTVHTEYPLSSHSPFERVQIDLMDVSHFKKWNGGTTFLFCCVDVYTKLAFVEPLKTKNDNDVFTAFKKMMNEILDLAGIYPTKVESDKESSFMSRQFKAFCKKSGISQVFVEGDIQCYVVERFNKTLRLFLYKYMTAHNTKTYLPVLQQIIDNYNNLFHESIKTTPAKALFNNDKYDELMAEQRAIADHEGEAKKYSHFTVGDRVRAKIRRTTFEKRTGATFTKTIHTVERVANGYCYISDRTTPYRYNELQLVTKAEQYKPQTEEDKKDEEQEQRKERKARTTQRRINKEGVDPESVEKDPEPRQMRKFRKPRDFGPMIQDD